MSIEQVPGTDLKFYQINFDAEGRERTDDPDGLMSELVAKQLQAQPVTDVFLLSHGWKGDIEAARRQYRDWIAAAAGCTGDLALMRKKRPGFMPLMIGLHWPSLPFGGEDMNEGKAGAASFAVGQPGSSPSEAGLEALIDSAAASIADTPAARQALRTLFECALDNAEPANLPEAARKAYAVLNVETKLGGTGVAGAPGADREPFNAESAYQNALGDPASFSGSFFSKLLSPLAQLSFWQMKARACTFGETGGAALLAKLQSLTAERKVRFHLMGHSFGCVVMSALAAGKPGSQRVRPLDSVLLVQGAFSLWSFCKSIPSAPKEAGYFQRMLAEGAVAGPIVTTQSEHDSAVGRLYPMAAGVAGQVAMAPGDELPKYGAVGTWGMQGAGVDAQMIELKSTDQALPFAAGKVYNLECSGIIKNGGGMAGAHNDISHPELGHAFWTAAMATL
jgi:hypothetical protein